MELKWQTLQEIYPEEKMVCAKWTHRVDSITTTNFQKHVMERIGHEEEQRLQGRS